MKRRDLIEKTAKGIDICKKKAGKFINTIPESIRPGLGNGKNVMFKTLLILILITFVSCDKIAKFIYPCDSNISGKYEFTLVPENSFQDTTLIKGSRGTDFPEYNSTYDDIYLYEDGKGNVTGYFKMWKISGIKSGQNLTLDLYDHTDGPVNLGLPVDSMHKFSTMNLTINEYGNLEGDGMYHNIRTLFAIGG